MFSVTARRLLAVGGGGSGVLCGPFHHTFSNLSPKRKTPAASSAKRSPSTPTAKAAVSSSSPQPRRNNAAAASSSSSSKPAKARGASPKAASASSALIGRPLQRRKSTSNALAPLKKLTDAEMAAIEDGSAVATTAEGATAAARAHQRKALQKAALNLNSFLSTAGQAAASSSSPQPSSSAASSAAFSSLPPPPPPPAMSGAQAVFLAQSAANRSIIGRGGSGGGGAGSAATFAPMVPAQNRESTYDDGTVDPHAASSAGDADEALPTSIRSGGSIFDFSKINEMNRSGGSSSSSGGGGGMHRSESGGNSQLIIDDGSGTASHLVFSPLNNRLMHLDSPIVASLLTIGFAVNSHSRELFLKHPEVLNEYAHAVRYGGIELPKCWRPKMVSEVGYILQNPRVEDPASHIAKLMEAKKGSRRANIGTIGGTSGSVGGDGTSASAAERAAQEESAQQNIILNTEQREVLEYALKGHCMYIGGSAGTGKTVLLTALKRRLTQEGLRVAMTATTGIAGCHIGGATFHHTFSVTATEEFANKKNLLAYDVVVIDEISMMSRRLFEEFDDALRHEAGINIPFGGVQVIVCGDFLQLSPVNEASIIDSPLFKENFVLTRLVQQVRQSQFPEFARMLGEIRHGTCPPLLEQAIKSLPPGTMAPDAINLLPTNIQVREANHKELERIEGPSYKLTPRVSEVKLEGEFTPTIMLAVGAEFSAAKLLMMAHDFIRQRVQIRNPRGFSLYRIFTDGYAFRIALPQAESALWKRTLVARFLEMAPLIDKWGLGCTVHNIVQDGTGLHTAEFEDSLARLLANHPVVQPQELKEGCRVLLRANLTTTLVNGSVGVVKGFCPCEKEYVHSYLRADSSVDSLIEEYNNYHKVELGYPATLPLVQFAEGMPPIAIPPQSITIGGTAATQHYALEGIAVPLTLAYAFTVHKVQGLTLVGRVHLELSKMWPCNHLLYVAMSRVRNPDQLSLSGFDPSMVVADPASVAFDEALAAREAIEVPSTATVAVWKGFDTYSVKKEFHKSIGGGASSSSSSSGLSGARGAAEVTEAAATAGKKSSKKDKTMSAVSRLKIEADNARLIEAANSGAMMAGDDGSPLSAGPADGTVFHSSDASDPSSSSVDSSEESSFAEKSKPASHHELLFQQMAQRGKGSYKYFTEGSGGGGARKSAEQRKKELLEKAKGQYISVVNPMKGSSSSSSSSSSSYSEWDGPSEDDAPPM